MSAPFYKRDTCRMCGENNSLKVLPLAPTALCDAYVPAGHLHGVQEVYPLELYLCRNCGYVYLPYVVDPEIIYRNYIYVTTSSLGLSKHFQGYADEVLRRINPPRGSLVVDIGSNDGTLLKIFQKSGMRVLGIEPAKQIAQDAKEAGIETIADFFSLELSEKIRKNYGSAAIITINNLLANIDDLEGLIQGIHRLLAADGVFIIESSYLGDMIQNMVFDFIYHEHLSYFSVKPLAKFLSRFGMELIDIEHVPTKRGSLRYYFQLREGKRAVSPSVGKMIAREETLGLDRPRTYQVFCEKINNLKSQLINQLNELKLQRKILAGYGGSATSTTLIYHFGLGKMMDYIVDDNPAKQNTFSPGYHIPVLPSEVLYERRPDYVLLLAWRYSEQIMKKHQPYLKQGGHFIIPLPELKII